MTIEAIGFDYVGVIANYPSVNRQMLALVDRLRTNYKVGLLSNLPSGWEPDLQRQSINEHFDTVILGGDQDLIKPDPRAYQALAAALKVKTNQLVFVDDSRINLSKVEVIGVSPVLFTGYEALLADLQTLGVTT